MEIKSFKEVEIEAGRDAAALRFKGASLAPLYVPGAVVAPTKEQAIACALEADPSLYERYRAQHNAAHIVRQLEAAGIRLTQR